MMLASPWIRNDKVGMTTSQHIPDHFCRRVLSSGVRPMMRRPALPRRASHLVPLHLVPQHLLSLTLALLTPALLTPALLTPALLIAGFPTAPNQNQAMTR